MMGVLLRRRRFSVVLYLLLFVRRVECWKLKFPFPRKTSKIDVEQARKEQNHEEECRPPPVKNESYEEEDQQKRQNFISYSHESLISDLIQWIQENGGSIDGRQRVEWDQQDGITTSVTATAFIPEYTILGKIPWSLVLHGDEPEDPNWRSDIPCSLIEKIQSEFQNYSEKQGSSSFGPYLRYLEHRMQYPVLPNGWSEAGQDLLETVLGDNLPPRNIKTPLKSFQRVCFDFEEVDDLASSIFFLVKAHRAEGRFRGLHQQVMLPFYDVYGHRDGHHYNLRIEQKDGNFVLVADRDIQPGEPIHTSLEDGTPMRIADMLQDFGVVGQSPQRFFFEFESELPNDTVNNNHLVDFYLAYTDDDHDEKRRQVMWVDGGRPHSNRAFDHMQREVDRLELLLDQAVKQDASYLTAVPKHEFNTIHDYVLALMDGMRHAIHAVHGEWQWTPATVPDFEVAGVNLGLYRLSMPHITNDENKRSSTNDAVEPFELFEDFDIGHLVNGTEGWKDMLEYRRTLERPSLSFYVDKIARKRWLSTQGYDQPHAYVLKYKHELTDNGTREDETEALLELLPNVTDYVAKPTHHSGSSGIWLVSHDVENNVTRYASKVRELVANDEDDDEFDKREVAKSLAKNLDAEPYDYESWVLKNVKGGIVIEDRFVDFNNFDLSAVEFSVFTIWGRVWVSQMFYVRGKKRYNGGNVNRDGTMADGSFFKDKMPYDYVDWPRVVDIAERLGANKDIFRVDIFVGIPASAAAAIRQGAKKEALLQYVVSECAYHANPKFYYSRIQDEAARLWVAGYMIGNYRTVPNTEVPAAFLEYGHLPEDFVSSRES